MKLVVRDGEEVGSVHIVHWWPGRDYSYCGDFTWYVSPIPAYVRWKAREQDSKYLTMTSVKLPRGDLATYAVCRKNDQPSRAKGRFIALLRMGRLLKSMGLKMEKA